MGAIAHWLEVAGIPTTGISLVRDNTERMRPPRALWVPFQLGRPFGVPHDAAFQSDVLRAALALLERRDGPVILEDYPRDAPTQSGADDVEGLVCPIPLTRQATGEDNDLLARINSEIRQLAPWHDLFCAARGGSTVGISKMSVTDAARTLCTILEAGRIKDVPESDYGKYLRYTSEDLRNWYLEAAIMRPGGAASAEELADWFWGETGAGELILALHPVCLASANASLRTVAGKSLVPRAQQHRIQQIARES